jgi:hypothetical protein
MRRSLLFWLAVSLTVSDDFGSAEPGRDTVTKRIARMMGGTWPKKDLEVHH